MVGTDAYFLLCYEVSSETVYMNPSYSTCYYYFTNDVEDFSSDLTVSLYPNPVSDVAYIKITGPSTGAIRTIDRITSYNVCYTKLLRVMDRLARDEYAD